MSRSLLPTPQSGNALFLILIAVALFAALSYAVTQSGRGGGGGGISKEQTSIQGAGIVQQLAVIRNAVLRMTLSGTPAASIICTDTPDPSNYDCDNAAGHGSPFCTTGASCIFSPTGGAARLPNIPPQAYDSTCPSKWFAIDGFNSTPDVSLPGVGSAANDDLGKVFCLRQDLCTEINKGLGITGIPEEGVNLPSGKEALCFKTVSGYFSTYGYQYVETLQAN